MDRIVFDRMAELDDRHWWFVARRRLLATLIARTIRPLPSARILEIGCGTGHNLAMLGKFGRVDAVEIDANARRYAEARLGRPVSAASLPELPGIPDAHYDLIALLDVLEHIEDDEAALRCIRTKLRPGGAILLTVPANPWMWSAHDVIHHHFRRYTKSQIGVIARKSGLEPQVLSHFNTLLFPVAAAARIVGKLSGRKNADDAIPSALVNAALTTIFGLERYLLGRVTMPVGVSLVAVLR